MLHDHMYVKFMQLHLKTFKKCKELEFSEILDNSWKFVYTIDELTLQ